MPKFSSASSTAFLIADPTRAAMLSALMDGRALPAGEIARAAGVAAQTASSHLAKLREGGLIEVEAQGRHRYYRLAGDHVAQTLEYLSTIQPKRSVRSPVPGPKHQALRHCRTCYNHLAGQVGVALARALQDRDCIRAGDEKQFVVTPAGKAWFAAIGIDVAAIKPTRQGLARQCLDWTERTHHLAGPLGVQLMRVLCANDWVRRSSEGRVVTVTPKGWLAFQRILGLDKASIIGSAGVVGR